MSLWNDIAESIGNKGITQTVNSEMGKILGPMGDSMEKSMGGGPLAKAASTIFTSGIRNGVQYGINKAIPPQYSYQINSLGKVLGRAASGDFEGAGLALLDSRLLSSILPGMNSVASQAVYLNMPSKLFGGLSPLQAKQRQMEFLSTELARKNLFFIEVSDPQNGDYSYPVNLLCTSLSFAPNTITGDKQKVGSTTVDAISSGEPVELRVSTYDTLDGAVKRWFTKLALTATHTDGTVGLPSEYAVRIRIVHSVLQGNGFEEIGLFRPANIEHELSRSEQAFAEMQLSFSQLDPFLDAKAVRM